MAPAADAKVFSAQATVADAPHPTQFTAALHSRSTSGSNAEAHVHEAVGFDTPATPLLHCAVDELLGSAFSLPARHCQPKIHPYSREQHKDPGSDGFRDSARGVSSVSWPFYQCLPARTALKSPRVTKDVPPRKVSRVSSRHFSQGALRRKRAHQLGARRRSRLGPESG